MRGCLWHFDTLPDLLQAEAGVIIIEGIEDSERSTHSTNH
jgi:hypothetical protein